MKKQKEIKICECGTPLIWTFAFAYAEYYCLNCGFSGGMLGSGKCVPATKELIFKQKLVKAIWKVIYSRKGLAPEGGRKINCKECDKSRYAHNSHLSESEKEWNEIAKKYLNQFKGIFKPL